MVWVIPIDFLNECHALLHDRAAERTHHSRFTSTTYGQQGEGHPRERSGRELKGLVIAAQKATAPEAAHYLHRQNNRLTGWRVADIAHTARRPQEGR